MLALKNVTKTYGKTRVLTGVSFEIRPKDNVCVIGDGASGKSTLLKLLVRAEDPTSGTVIVDGVDLKAVPPAILQLYRRRLGTAFQEPMLLEHATVAENVALPLELFGAPEAIVKRATNDLLKRLGLEEKARRLAGDLSTSERSLVGIARAIVAAPMIVAIDEPLLHLDATQAKLVTDLLRTMHKHGTTLVLFGRSPETAKAFGSRALALKDGAIAQEKKAAPVPKAAATHRILETPEEPEETEEETSPKNDRPSAPHEPKEGGRRIRITSIGSGL